MPETRNTGITPREFALVPATRLIVGDMLGRPDAPWGVVVESPMLTDGGLVELVVFLAGQLCPTKYHSTRDQRFGRYAHKCLHTPLCPSADALDHDAAAVVATFPAQGWSLLCNGVYLFEDTGELVPLEDGRMAPVAPHRGSLPHILVDAA